MTLLVAASCTSSTRERSGPASPSAAALGTIPASEVAVWTRKVGTNNPEERIGQAVAFDETRRVVLMFGGLATAPDDTRAARQELWEWDPAQSRWTDRTPAGVRPAARSEAALAYDSTHDKLILFGGRSTDGNDFDDTWEWDPPQGAWTQRSSAGIHPEARARHSMVFDKDRSTVLLFGGGRSAVPGGSGTVAEAAGISMAFGSTWEYDVAGGTWTERTPASGPSARFDSAFVWDTSRGRAILFGGMEKTNAALAGVPMQDVWEWDGATQTWTARAPVGVSPSARFGHTLAFDSQRGRAMLFAGYDVETGGAKSDLWEWNPAAATWAQITPTGRTAPSARLWASAVYDASRARMEVVGGSTMTGTTGSDAGQAGITFLPTTGTNLSRETWDFDPATQSWVSRVPVSGPAPRYGHAMATDFETGKVYLFGGLDESAAALDDLWVWDGSRWTACPSSDRPAARYKTSLAYDPSRKSLILFGGSAAPTQNTEPPAMYGDTWEWNIAQGGWSNLSPAASPPSRWGHLLMTDAHRGSIMLMGGARFATRSDMGPWYNDLWKWDGVAGNWIDISPPAGSSGPNGETVGFAVLGIIGDTLLVLAYSADGSFWEWNLTSGGWTARRSDSSFSSFSIASSTCDLNRGRVVALGSASRSLLEFEPLTRTWFERPLPAQVACLSHNAMAFDQRRATVVIFGGLDTQSQRSDALWEYRVDSMQTIDASLIADSAVDATTDSAYDSAASADAARDGEQDGEQDGGQDGEQDGGQDGEQDGGVDGPGGPRHEAGGCSCELGAARSHGCRSTVASLLLGLIWAGRRRWRRWAACLLPSRASHASAGWQPMLPLTRPAASKREQSVAVPSELHHRYGIVI